MTFQNGVEIIGESSFWGTALIEVVIPSSVKRLEYRAFSGYDDGKHNTTLQKVVLNEGLESIGDYCFRCNDGLREVVIPSSVKSIGNCAFDECRNLSRVTLQEGLQSIGDWCFYSTNLPEVIVPRSVQNIGRDAFSSNVVFSRPADYHSEGVLTPNMVREQLSKMQGEKVFVVPEGIKIIYFGCFMNSDVERVTLPSSVKEIRWGAFNNCKKLR